jgi:putative ABC transport system permease protein
MYHVDADFIPAYGITLLKGRNFSEDITTDKKSAAIINEAAAKKFGIRDIEGAVIEDQSDKGIYNVIGLIRDFHNESMHGEIKPVIIRGIDPDRDDEYLRPRYMTVMIKSGDVPGVMASIEKTYSGLIPDQLLEYFFMDDLYDSFYKEDARFNRIFLYSSTLAIFLSCLGLFGLTTFIIRRKTKEIGIRKTLGASVPGILFLLSKEFLKWVLLANVIAWPAAYLVMDQWLRSYAYRTSIGIWAFIVSGLLALLVALLTIGYQSVSAANANPVDALKYE